MVIFMLSGQSISIRVLGSRAICACEIESGEEQGPSCLSGVESFQSS